MGNKIEVLFSFDTTGSMYPCLTQVRKNVKSTVKRIFKEIPDIRIGIVAHGDHDPGIVAGATERTMRYKHAMAVADAGGDVAEGGLFDQRRRDGDVVLGGGLLGGGHRS